MARNGSGTMQPISNSWYPPISGQLAAAGDWQAIYLDLIAALTQSLSRDGQGPMTGNLQMGGNKITGQGAADGTGQALIYEQLFNQGTEQDLASAATTDIGAQLTNFLRITGTTTITSFGTNYKGPRFLRFAGAVLLTNSSTLVLPGGANITTAAGDCLIVIPTATLGTADGWQVIAYQKNIVPGTVANNSITAAMLTDTAAVKLTLDQTIAGVKTFSSSPVSFNPSSANNTTKVASYVFAGADTVATAKQTGVVMVSPEDANYVASFLSFFVRSGDALQERMRIASNGQQSSVIPGGSTLYPEFKCRAWVNFNGTGTVAVRASGNVSSITDNGPGTYTVNFTTAMPDSNYSLGGTASGNNTVNNSAVGSSVCTAMNLTTPIQYNTSGIRISVGQGNTAPSDIFVDVVNVQIYR